MDEGNVEGEDMNVLVEDRAEVRGALKYLIRDWS